MMSENNTHELTDELLADVAGGAFGDMATCPVCGKPKLEGYICIWCEMADGVVTCHKCRGQLTKEGGCANCGTTWDEYVQLTKRLRGE
jgi:hypothetical protein